MTREEANEELERAFDVLDHSCHMDARRKEAFNMARVALFLEPSIEAVSFWCRQNGYVMMPEAVYEQDITKAYFEGQNAEPCEDTISRHAVLTYIEFILTHGMGKKKSFEFIKKYVERQPSVTPKQKMCFDGMTNGEVIDLLFPGADIYHNRDFTLREMIFPDEWWDEPYTAESEDTE